MKIKKLLNLALFFNIIFILACCNSTKIENQQGTDFKNLSIKTLARPEPDQQGIISYSTYQIFIANGKETIEEIAYKLNIKPDQLALYNGLIINYRPREGEVLALPERVNASEIKVFKDWSEESTRETIKTEVGIEIKNISNPNYPTRHRVKSGETAYTIAKFYNVSVKSLANWNGLGPDLNVRVGREIIIPAAATSKEYNSKAEDQNKGTNNEVDRIDENSSENDLIDNISQVEKKEKESEDEKNIVEIDNEISNSNFVIPVNGKIKNEYNPFPSDGEKKNNGIDFEVNGKSEIKATFDGVVVLISEKAVGSSGKIVLMKHENELISIYGGIEEIFVEKGQKIKKSTLIGKSIGNENDKSIVHFEIRQGMKSIDPMSLIK